MLLLSLLLGVLTQTPLISGFDAITYRPIASCRSLMRIKAILFTAKSTGASQNMAVQDVMLFKIFDMFL